jgi:hypothetical protein
MSVDIERTTIYDEVFVPDLEMRDLGMLTEQTVIIASDDGRIRIENGNERRERNDVTLDPDMLEAIFKWWGNR